MTAHSYQFLKLIAVSVLIGVPSILPAQPKPSQTWSKADSLRKEYRFEEAVQLCDEALAASPDSLMRVMLQDLKLQAENGARMMDFVSQPKVVARHRFSIEDFYLYYPLEDNSWRPTPNVLDTLGNHKFAKAAYVPEGVSSIHFSGVDESGARNIYRTDSKDTSWCVPYIVDEKLMSPGDEIFPMFSPDGKMMFFASSGLYGMGGYDLYSSSWDEEKNEWTAPTNMGFPFSSPADDFLFVNTADGRYTVFASNRDCPSDSVWVYVLEYEPLPVRKSLRSVARLKELMTLEQKDDVADFKESEVVSHSLPENVDTRRYMDKVVEVKALKDSIYLCSKSMDSKRELFAESDDPDERASLTAEILRQEQQLPVFQDSLERATAILQKIEMEFLFKGVVLDPDELMNEADKEVEVASSTYAFTRMNMGKPLDIVVEKPEVKFDYTFMVLPEGRFAEDNTLPDGVIYQIQIFSLSKKASVKDIRGLSPVFEARSSSGRYIYRVGLFRKYNDALANLNQVKRQGFKTAFITPFNDGRVVPMAKARSLEKQVKIVPVYQINIVPFDGILPEITVRAIAQMCGKDIAKSEKEGKTVYFVGPFDDLGQMEKVISAIKATGITDVEQVKIGQREIK